MKENMGPTDRIIRLVASIIFVYMFYAGVVTGALGVVLLVVGLVFFLTSVSGKCPLYSLLGWNTCKRVTHS